MSNSKSISLAAAAISSLLPYGWNRLSSDSLAGILAPSFVLAMEEGCKVAHYTQEHHNAVFDGLRAIRPPK